MVAWCGRHHRAPITWIKKLQFGISIFRTPDYDEPGVPKWSAHLRRRDSFGSHSRLQKPAVA